MTSARGTTTRLVAAGTCCVVAALAYSGAVTVLALLTFVLPSVGLAAVLTSLVARLSVRAAVAVGVLAALVLAELVNLVSGTANGPAARSSFAAAAFTVLSVAAVLGPVPALFTAGVVGVVVGALGLGAGAEIAPVAVATAVVTVVALAVVEAQSRRWTGRSQQLLDAVLAALLVGGLVAAIALQAGRRLDGSPAVLAPGAVQQTIRPPQVLGDPDPRPTPTPTPSATATRAVDGAAASSSHTGSALSTVWLVVLLALVGVLLAAALRVLWVALAWRLLRRRLRRGSGPELVTGAWLWATRRLRTAGWPMPPSLPVDAVEAGRGLSQLPRAVRPALRQLAGATVDAVYAPPGEPDPAKAWTAADEVGRVAVTSLGTGRRLGFAVRPVTSVPSRSAALVPATPGEQRS